MSTTGLLETYQVEVVDILNKVLANESTLSLKTRNYHWNVVGLNFSELHKFFDAQYEQLDDILDQVAERSRVMGGKSIATMTEFLVKTSLKEQPKQHPEAQQMVSNLLRDHEVEWTPVFSTTFCIILHTVTLIYFSSPIVWQTHWVWRILMQNVSWNCCNPKKHLQLRFPHPDSLQTRAARCILFLASCGMIQHARFAQECDGK